MATTRMISKTITIARARAHRARTHRARTHRAHAHAHAPRLYTEKSSTVWQREGTHASCRVGLSVTLLCSLCAACAQLVVGVYRTPM